MLTLCARWSRVIATGPGDDGEPHQDGYAKTTLVVVIEAVKIVVAFMLLCADREGGVAEAWQYLSDSTIKQPGEVGR